MNFVLALFFSIFAAYRLLTYLHIYQQEEYDSDRFLKWLIRTWSVDLTASGSLIVVGILTTLHLVSSLSGVVLLSAAFALLAYRERQFPAKAKKALVMTSRARRIYYVALSLVSIIALMLSAFSPFLWLWLLAIQGVPLTMLLANTALSPYERTAQRRLWHEAHEKLLQLHPTVIGITGSYGKTSVKHVLGHVLGFSSSTLITPGSVNTPMGVTRIVRERLAAHHRFFVCEMGAYAIGSIARLCKLAPPDLAIITSVGLAHMERFKTVEAVTQAKFELAEDVVERNGIVILAEQVLKQPHAESFRRKHASKIIIVGRAENSDCRIFESTLSSSGLEFKVSWNGKVHLLSTHLFGEHQISNIALVFAASCALGMQPDDVVLALRSVPQVKHRLEVRDGPLGSTIIDDAYNSNPIGFANALEMLDLLRVQGGRRILVTPGMVELGTSHDEEHQRLGTTAAACVDVLLPVKPKRIDSFVRAYAQFNPSGTIVECDSYAQAERWMEEFLNDKDVVLIENDLPDLYETVLRL